MNRLTLTVILLIALAGCEKPPSQKVVLQLNAESLPSDNKATEALLVKRLNADISTTDDLLIIHDKSLPGQDMIAVPKHTDWRIHCGQTGVRVQFGSNESTALILTTSPIKDTSRCTFLITMLGTALVNTVFHS